MSPRRASSKTAILGYPLFALALVGYAPTALATDDLNCQSLTWTLTIASGTSGYVNSLSVHKKTPSQVEEPVVIRNLAGDARHVDIKARVIDVKATAPDGKALNIRLKGGKGVIQYLGTSEQLVCDWTT